MENKTCENCGVNTEILNPVFGKNGCLKCENEINEEFEHFVNGETFNKGNRAGYKAGLKATNKGER